MYPDHLEITHSILDHLEITHSILDHLEITHSILDHLGITHSILDHLEITLSILYHLEITHSILDHLEITHSILDHVEITHSILDHLEITHSILDHLEITHSIWLRCREHCKTLVFYITYLYTAKFPHRVWEHAIWFMCNIRTRWNSERQFRDIISEIWVDKLRAKKDNNSASNKNYKY